MFYHKSYLDSILENRNENLLSKYLSYLIDQDQLLNGDLVCVLGFVKELIKEKDEVFSYLEKHGSKKRIKNNLMPSSKSYLY